MRKNILPRFPDLQKTSIILFQFLSITLIDLKHGVLPSSSSYCGCSGSRWCYYVVQWNILVFSWQKFAYGSEQKIMTIWNHPVSVRTAMSPALVNNQPSALKMFLSCQNELFLPFPVPSKHIWGFPTTYCYFAILNNVHPTVTSVSGAIQTD